MSKSRQAPDRTILVRSFGVSFQSGRIRPPQSGNWHQLLYATRGVIQVRTEQETWVVPPHRAIWVPAQVAYRVEMTGPVALRSLYFTAAAGKSLGDRCALVNVTPLLRELIHRTIDIGALDGANPRQRRLASVIFDEIEMLRDVPLQLPMPSDPRALRFVRAVESNASSKECGASRRTLERLFRDETGMSLGQWVRRERLLRAVSQLGRGESVTIVAEELGYSSPSAFIAMFRRELGQPPGAWFSTFQPVAGL